MTDTVGNATGDMQGRRRLDLKAAAAELGVTSEAIRRRAKRGTLLSEKGEDGLLYVWLPAVPHGMSDTGDTEAQSRPHSGPHDVSAIVGVDHDAVRLAVPDVLLERYESENDFLRRELEHLHRELERKDAILLTLAQRVPELEHAPSTSSDVPERPHTASEEESRGTGQTEEGEVQRASWWRRWVWAG